MISRFEKVKPRINYHNYKIHHFYLYVYLDPFKEEYYKFNIGGEIVEFAYRPIYIGKATNAGFRHNQRIAEYLKNGREENRGIAIHNQIKKDYFKAIETNMIKLGNSSPDYPRDWKEYQKNWVIIMKSFQTQIQLMQAEAMYIKTIGTIRKKTGPLTNALLG